MEGYVQVYTGNGKGKTTAAIGLSIRAAGAGKRVLFLQFMKDLAYSEHKILRNLEPELELQCFGKPFFIATEGRITEEEKNRWGKDVVVFPYGSPPDDYKLAVAKGLSRAKEAVTGGEYDLVILDEIVCALAFGLISWEDISSLINERDPKTELVLTGRDAPKELIDRADLVTEMKEIKHYYAEKGVNARCGIES